MHIHKLLSYRLSFSHISVEVGYWIRIVRQVKYKGNNMYLLITWFVFTNNWYVHTNFYDNRNDFGFPIVQIPGWVGIFLDAIVRNYLHTALL